MLSCLISQLRCLICGSSCVLCCPICPSVNESTSTRLAFAAFLLFGTFVSTLMTSPYFFDDLTAIPADDHFRNSSNCDESELGARCPITTGSLIVYRISFAMFLFYLIFMLVTARVKTSKSFRAKLHNGFWLWKILLICCLTSIAFKCSFNGFWRDVWMYTGMVASCAYVIINMLFMIEISYSWTEKILQKERCKSFWYLLLIFSIITLIVISILLTIYLHIHFAPSRRCQLNSAFITLISTTCFFFFIFAIIVAAKTKKAYTYLLPTAFMTAYVLFMTWSTLTSIPKSDSTIGKEQPQWCAPDIEVVNIDQKYVAYISVFISVFVTIATSIKTSARSRSLGVPIEPSTPKKKAKKSNKHKSSSSLCCCLCLCLKRRGDNKEETYAGQNLIRNESDGITYSYSFFHFMFMLAAFHNMMQLTNWNRPDSASLANFGRSMPTVYMKGISAIACILIFGCTLIVSCFCPKKPKMSQPSAYEA